MAEEEEFNRREDGRFLTPKHKYILIIILVSGIAALGWGYYTYGDFALAASEMHKNTTAKLTTTEVPLDWREVDVVDLKPEEITKVQQYATAQAVFDIMIAASIIIGMLMLLVYMQDKSIGQMTTSNVVSMFFAKDFGLLMLSVILIGFGIYMLIETWRIGLKRELPFYMKWMYGNEYQWFSPYNMIGTILVCGGFAALLLGKVIQPPDVLGLYTAGTAKKANLEDKLKLYVVIMIVMYVIYSFYGAYLTNMVKQSKDLEPYLKYLYPAIVSCAISILAALASEDKQAGLVAALACAGLIAFRDIGRQINDYWLLTSLEFWWNAFMYFMAAVVLATIFSLATTKKTDQIVKVTTTTGRTIYKRVSAQLGNASTETLFVAALLGGFFFFSLQLFWTTTMVLGDALVASLAIIIMLLFSNDVTKLPSGTSTAVYSGFLVTAILWFTTISHSGFQAMIK